MKKTTLILSFFLFVKSMTFAQSGAKIADEVIVKLSQLAVIEEVIEKINGSERSANASLVRTIDADLKYFLLKINQEEKSDDEMLYFLRSQKGIEEASFNFRAEPRSTTPNDSLFSRQWGMTRIQADLVWDATTGGKTACGDEIVVAVVEPGYGFSLTHKDLIPNLFVNKGEIANDGKDNDGNGYTDDVNGINAETSRGNISGDPQVHGTSVCGIIGAKGNNKLCSTGVNWDVKMLLISNATTQADVIASYSYILKMRKLYNDSKGQKGAYIVVTNYSGGIDNQFEKDFPLWCGMYNQMGDVGILSVGAGPNQNTNVDLKGDIPTTCSSNYFIGVTNSDRLDNRVTNAGFGIINIDLAAPGGSAVSAGGLTPTGSMTIKADPTNVASKEFTGTSAATPYVAGAIALLYSIKDTAFCNAAKKNPKEIALFIKNTLIENVDKTTALRTETVSGGRLNINKAFIAINNNLKPAASSSLVLFPNPTSKDLSFKVNSISGKKQTYYVYNSFGQLILTEEYTPKPFTVNKVSIDVTNIAKGVYTLSTLDDNGKWVSQKFVVQ